MTCVRCFREIPEGSQYCSFCGKRQSAAAPAARRKSRRPRGSGTVYRLSGVRQRPWAARRDGVYIGYYPSKAEAMAALERLAGKDLTDSYNYTLAQVYDCWRAEHFPTLSEKGREMYAIARKRMEPLAGRKMRELRAADYQAIINAMEDDGLSASSASKVKQLVGQLSKWAMREDLITTNYAQFVRIYAEEKKEKEIFTADELEILRRHDHLESVRVILLLIYTGLRIGELFTHLMWDNVHLQEGYMVTGSKTEAGRNRIIPIIDEVMPYVRYFYARSRAGEKLMAGYEGNRTPSNFRRRDYADTLKELGIRPLTPHSTRHTFATLAVKAGMRPEILQQIIGHASYTTTVEIYNHNDLDSLREEMRKLTVSLQIKSGQPSEGKEKTL